MATSFWGVMQKRIGKDVKVYADLHKTDDKIYHTVEDAEEAWVNMPLASFFHVVELVALTLEEWEMNMTERDVLREFVADCEAAYPAFDGSPEFTAAAISEEWPDLASTYLHAKDVLKGVLTTLYE